MIQHEIYLYFTTDSLKKRQLNISNGNEITRQTNVRFWDLSSVRVENFECNFPPVPPAFEYTPAVCLLIKNKYSLTKMHIQAAQANFGSKLHFKQCYHPVLQLYMLATWRRKEADAMGKKLVLPRPVRCIVQKPLERNYHRNYAAVLLIWEGDL